MAKELYYEDVNVGDEIPTLVKKPTTQQLVMYAGASGDFYQIHYDHHFAVNAGLSDGVIVHGMLSMGWLAQMLTDWLPDWALRKIDVRFAAMARPGDTISCKGKVTDKYQEDGKNFIDCEISCENQEGAKTVIGTATAELPSKG
jgi:acyl dehydratase